MRSARVENCTGIYTSSGNRSYKRETESVPPMTVELDVHRARKSSSQLFDGPLPNSGIQLSYCLSTRSLLDAKQWDTA